MAKGRAGAPELALSEEKRREFESLFAEFAKTYAPTPEGIEHIRAYERNRRQGRENFAAAIEAEERGEDVTELVLLKLLPYENTKGNRERGAWIHVAPAVQGDVKRWFERRGWKKPDDWPHAARAILYFVRRCAEDPSRLREACKEFSASPYAKGFQTGFLTPILNALRPEEFLLINNKSRRTIDYFAGTSHGQLLRDYPEINETGWRLIEEAKGAMNHPALAELSEADRLDMFAHWLVSVKKHPLKETEAPSLPPARRSPFSEETFTLLEGLHANPTRDFYQERRAEFEKHVEKPFRRLLRRVAESLPDRIAGLMETRKNVFARIPKNDYGHGGAWDFYWGAFYPRGGKRTTDAQLFAVIHRDRLEFGFHVGERGTEQRERFVRNCVRHRQELVRLLRDGLSEEEIGYGEGERRTSELERWTESPERLGVHASAVMPKEEVLQSSEDQLAERVLRVFNKLFPLVLLATRDEPPPEILGHPDLAAEGAELNPVYTLAQLAEEVGLEEEMLGRWVRAIERKGQAILYGPPGTGKTFLAERLARHLTGGGNGLQEIVQFHPSYAYEDFIQGIRPRSRDGRLEYPLVPGRFLEFCREAEKRSGRCVMIIDEINRADLSRVFGELMYLLEYRDREVPLSGGGRFSIPSNVYIIGTMNTADRSIALVDYALRRRFAFLGLYPNHDVLRRYHVGTGFPVEGLIRALERVNREIGDRHYAIGITFFLRKNLRDEIEDIWRMEIEPYLEEYFFDRPEKADQLRWTGIEETIFS